MVGGWGQGPGAGHGAWPPCLTSWLSWSKPADGPRSLCPWLSLPATWSRPGETSSSGSNWLWRATACGKQLGLWSDWVWGANGCGEQLGLWSSWVRRETASGEQLLPGSCLWGAWLAELLSAHGLGGASRKGMSSHSTRPHESWRRHRHRWVDLETLDRFRDRHSDSDPIPSSGEKRSPGPRLTPIL